MCHPSFFSTAFRNPGLAGVTRSLPLADAGFRVLVPDQRGYGLSDKPEVVTASQLHSLGGGDVIGLLSAFVDPGGPHRRA